MIEDFIDKHTSSLYAEVGALLQAVSSKRILPASFGQNNSAVKRTRVAIKPLWGKFIDAYAASYKSLSKNPAARENLIKSILTTASAREVELGSASWSATLVVNRLKNTIANQRRAMCGAALPLRSGARTISRGSTGCGFCPAMCGVLTGTLVCIGLRCSDCTWCCRESPTWTKMLLLSLCVRRRVP